MRQKKKKGRDQLLAELVHELSKMSIQDLLQFRSEWLSELRGQGLPQALLDFCSKAIDLVIQKKIEKMMKIVGGTQV